MSHVAFVAVPDAQRGYVSAEAMASECVPRPMAVPQRSEVTIASKVSAIMNAMVSPVAGPVTMLMKMVIAVVSEAMSVRLGGSAATQQSQDAEERQYKFPNHYASLQTRTARTYTAHLPRVKTAEISLGDLPV